MVQQTRYDYHVPNNRLFINKFREYAIDMLRNISLSACADQVKFAVAYKDFIVDGDYSQETKTTFKLTEEYFKKKIDEYKQDIKAKRNITNNITMEYS
jgi:LPS O-antigen subunit length determinant protein (WzzB/FepE family)